MNVAILQESIFLWVANSLPRLPVFNRIRFLFLLLSGFNIKGKCTIWAPISVTPIGNAYKVSLGKGTFINSDVRFGAASDISLGQNVQIGPRVSFETMNHSLECSYSKLRSCISRSIVIEDNVWIGCGAIILQGVTVGEGSVIAAGAVVNKDIPAYTLAGGVPAKSIKSISSVEGQTVATEQIPSVSTAVSHG